MRSPSLRLHFSLLSILFVAPFANAAEPAVERLSPQEGLAAVNPAGSAVHLRAAIDQATVGAAKKFTSCVNKATPILVSDIAGVQRLIAERKVAQAELDRIQAELTRLKTTQLPPEERRNGNRLLALEARNRDDIAPFMTDVVRVSDSIRFLTSLFTAEYVYSSEDVSPTPGLVEATLFGGGARRLAQPVSANSPTLEAFAATEKLRDEVQGHLEGLLADANEAQTKELAPAVASLAALTDRLQRYLTPGESGGPSPLSVLIGLDYSLPRDSEAKACYVSFTTSADVTSVHTKRFLPSRKFDVMARSVVVVSVAEATEGSFAVTNSIHACTVKIEVDPKAKTPSAFDPLSGKCL